VRTRDSDSRASHRPLRTYETEGDLLVIDNTKRNAAERAVQFVSDGHVVGLGTGSTAAFAIQALGRLVKDGLRITGVPTSRASELLARYVGITLIELNDVERVDITIDGADEVDPALNMIKGGGGALTREKLVALSSDRRVYVVDETKLVARLGQSFAVPVEVLSFAWAASARRLALLGCKPTLRRDRVDPLITDNGNYILDCRFSPIDNPLELETAIKLVPGVIECGLFVGIADALVVAFTDRIEVRDAVRV
jgi:ribose 5-phosphate isomerase A